MKTLKKIAFILYPFGVILLLPYLLTREAKAGQIRDVYTTGSSTIPVYLKFKMRTVLSFDAKPEKAVPGSSGNIEIDFIGKDLVVSPISKNPGNLIVYTSTGRFVLNFKVQDGNHYDDVVTVHLGSNPKQFRRAVKLDEATYIVSEITIDYKKKGAEGTSQDVPVSLRTDKKVIGSAELLDSLSAYRPLKCSGCLVSFEKDTSRIICSKPISKIQCENRNAKIYLTLKDIQ